MDVGFFFRDFTHRYWGFPPTELSATFVRSKMPRLSFAGKKAEDAQALPTPFRGKALRRRYCAAYKHNNHCR